MPLLCLSIGTEHSPLGGADKFLDWLCCNSEITAVFYGANAAQGELYAMLIVPLDVGIQLLHEVVSGRVDPGAIIVHLVFQPSEEALAG